MVNNFNELCDMLVLLNKVIIFELSGKLLFRDENDCLYFYGGWLEQMKMVSVDFIELGQEVSEFDENVMFVVVVDVVIDGKELVFEEGIGFVDDLYVLVFDWNGKFQVVYGGVYSQYEFMVLFFGCLIDEVWCKQFFGGKFLFVYLWLDGVWVK